MRTYIRRKKYNFFYFFTTVSCYLRGNMNTKNFQEPPPYILCYATTTTTANIMTIELRFEHCPKTRTKHGKTMCNYVNSTQTLLCCFFFCVMEFLLFARLVRTKRRVVTYFSFDTIFNINEGESFAKKIRLISNSNGKFI